MPLAAVACGHLRASDADREQVIEVLKSAFAQGQLAKNDFEPRIGQAFAARTYAELADVAAGLAGTEPVRKPDRVQVRKAAAPDPARARAKKAAGWSAYGIVLPAIIAALIIPGYANIGVAVATTAAVYFIFWLIGSFIMIANAEW
jgi:Domain of unknown function (DUF1707)